MFPGCVCACVCGVWCSPVWIIEMLHISVCSIYISIPMLLSIQALNIYILMLHSRVPNKYQAHVRGWCSAQVQTDCRGCPLLSSEEHCTSWPEGRELVTGWKHGHQISRYACCILCIEQLPYLVIRLWVQQLLSPWWIAEDILWQSTLCCPGAVWGDPVQWTTSWYMGMIDMASLITVIIVMGYRVWVLSCTCW